MGTLDSDATVFSFYANKTITTGEGGAIVCDDEELYSRLRRRCKTWSGLLRTPIWNTGRI